MTRLFALLGCLVFLAACDVVVTTSAPQPATVTTSVAAESASSATETPAHDSGNEQASSGLETTENVLETLVAYLAIVAEVCGAIVIGVAVLREFMRYLPHIFRFTRDSQDYQEDIRLRLGKSLALALEFELGADILRTAVAPTFNVIAITAAVIVLRIVLNYFLERELREVEERRERRGMGDQTPRTAGTSPDTHN